MAASSLEILKRYFGYEAFRGGQEEAVETLLRGRDLLCVMPTGAGKSLCYQVPALMLPGITLVISPLISLMKDQVSALVGAGVPAAFLNSSLSFGQYQKALGNLRAGKYKIVYVAPERLTAPGFQEVCGQLRVSLLAVDEAHCISQWGQDFRPDYLKIPEFAAGLSSRPVTAAFTATATPQVSRDIELKLGLDSPHRIRTGFDRPNLFFSVRTPENKDRALLAWLADHPSQSGIIYCATRKNVEQVCSLLQGHGFSATRYHAGLSQEERKRNQDDFSFDRVPVIAATNAFGMGIDKSNVSWVIHYNMPKSLEAYYQEAGRAGRDGEPAECVLLFSPQDVVIARHLIDMPGENEELTEEDRAVLREADYQRLRRMTDYATGTGCLRAEILKYFGQENPPARCGNCSNCLGQYEAEDITVQARMILSCVARTGQKYGSAVIADVLKGTVNPRYERLGFPSQSTFGLMRDLPLREIRQMIAALVVQNYLCTSDGDYPVLWLTKQSGAVLNGSASVSMKKLQKARTKPERKKRSRPEASSGREENGLFEALRALRFRIAARENVPAYIVFSDATLREMAEQRPRNAAEMMRVGGVGERKMEKYGDEFLREIASSEGGKRESAPGAPEPAAPGRAAFSGTGAAEKARPEENRSRNDVSAGMYEKQTGVASRNRPKASSAVSAGSGRHPSAGSPWTEEEDRTLREEYAGGVTISEMALTHGRTRGAVESRLKKLNLLPEKGFPRLGPRN